MSNFDFLQKEWPLVAKLAQTAENYIYDDPNSCLIKLGMLAEHIVSYIVDVNDIAMSEEANTQADKIRQLKAKALLPRDIDDILYGLRKARNEAVHANLDSFERACLMLELAYYCKKLSIRGFRAFRFCRTDRIFRQLRAWP